MSLKSLFDGKKTTSSSKAKFYNEEKTKCIVEMATHKNAVIRKAVAMSSHTPYKILTGMLQAERDKQVLRAVLMNDRLSKKAVYEFISNTRDERVDWFDGDQELLDHFNKGEQDD